MKSALGMGALLIAAVLWGMFVAPKASVVIAEPYRLVVELAIFASAFAVLHVSGQKPQQETHLTIRWNRGGRWAFFH
ncbi:YrdB family protein [Paenibacillus sp. WST5]|uniref:YrdB family protein n=1 Tax=Paenibacillus sedimenti TaxID=2770274 RepID=A0A926KTK6_9BACL|nr:YrdB family protein [Paenibacillus sedimenti]